MGYYVSAVESNLVVNKKRAINCIKKLMELIVTGKHY